MTKRSSVFWVSVALLLICMPVSVRAADDDVATLRARVDRLTKENADLKAQLAAMQAESAKLRAAAPDDARPVETGDSAAANKAVCIAIQTFLEKVSSIHEGGETTAQQRGQWVAAAKAMDEILAGNRVTLTCKVSDVTFNQASNTAEIDFSQVIVKSGDTKILDVEFKSFYSITVAATEEQAEKIPKGGSITAEGILCLHVDGNAAADRPGFTTSRDAPPAGFMAIGIVDGQSSLWQQEPFFLMKRDLDLKVAGVTQKVVPNKDKRQHGLGRLENAKEMP